MQRCQSYVYNETKINLKQMVIQSFIPVRMFHVGTCSGKDINRTCFNPQTIRHMILMNTCCDSFSIALCRCLSTLSQMETKSRSCDRYSRLSSCLLTLFFSPRFAVTLRLLKGNCLSI